ncbi:MAG: hypothetical protein HYY50_05165, partial [Candidatus Kerfeldbacteria bacterium]|nr:hypothetical protein [Candidatus Kerfeldbacteria bacterium]
ILSAVEFEQRSGWTWYKDPTWIIREFLVSLITRISVLFLEGWVFSVLWSWFVVPTIGLKEISVLGGTGLMIVIKLIRAVSVGFKLRDYGYLDMNVMEYWEEYRKNFAAISVALRPFEILLVGWVVHLFM